MSKIKSKPCTCDAYKPLFQNGQQSCTKCGHKWLVAPRSRRERRMARKGYA